MARPSPVLDHRREPRRAGGRARKEGARAVGRRLPHRHRACERGHASSRGPTPPPAAPWSTEPPAGGKVTGTRTIAELGVTVVTLSNGVEVWMKPTDFKNDQVLFSAYALGGSVAGAEAGIPGRRDGVVARRRRRRRRVQPGGSQPDARREDRQRDAQHQHLYAGDQRLGHAARHRDGAAAQLPGVHRPELHGRDAGPAEAPPWGRAREPGAEPQSRLRREGQPRQHVQPLLRADDHHGRPAEPEAGRDAAVLPGAFRQRRRLHVLLRRRVQGARADAARRALDRRLALDGQEDRGLPRHGRALPGRRWCARA